MTTFTQNCIYHLVKTHDKMKKHSQEVLYIPEMLSRPGSPKPRPWPAWSKPRPTPETETFAALVVTSTHKQFSFIDIWILHCCKCNNAQKHRNRSVKHQAIHLLVSTFDTSNVAVAHNLRSCSRPPSETKTKTRQAETKTREAKTETRTSRVETKTKTSKSGLDRSRDQDQVSRPTSLVHTKMRPAGHKRPLLLEESDHVVQNRIGRPHIR